ncbi:hypothetical protein BJV74DRAFT_870351 [Russula compacta]|nr:hypothetical protein BJV74DRAFT_870351 [Russula compacta]
MEDPPRTTQFFNQSDTPQLRYQAANPDVLEDVDDGLMAHFNDANWGSEANSSTLSASTDGVDHRRRSRSFNRKGAGTEADAKPQVEWVPLLHIWAAVGNTDDPTISVNTFRV